MGHRQDMTPEQRLKWDCENYQKRLDAKRGSNYEYWTDKHDKMLDNGWMEHSFDDKRIKIHTTYEDGAKQIVKELRSKGNYARIVCITNKLRIRTYTIIYKPKKVKETPKELDFNEWLYCGCFIQKQEHPKLFGKYEVFKNNEEQTHIGRAMKFSEAKKLCEDNPCSENFLVFL